MDRRIRECTVNGDVSALLNILKEDKLVLQREEANSVENPLHISAMLGHTDFVKELLKHRPELARGKNQQGFTPLHLASKRGHIEVVTEILNTDPSLCLERDREGNNSLHLAVINGNVHIVSLILDVFPDSGKQLTGEGENMWHLSVKNDREEIVRFLADREDLRGMAAAVDAKGNGVLHLAVARNSIQMVNLLIGNPNIQVNVNAVNVYGFTPLDLFFEFSSCSRLSSSSDQYVVIADALLAAGATRNMNIPAPPLATNINTDHEDQSTTGSDGGKLKRARAKIMEQTLVVAILIATVSFQSVTSPPGGFWQDTTTSTVNNTAAEAPTPMGSNTNYSTSTSSSLEVPHVAGRAVLRGSAYDNYMQWNIVAFMSSMIHIVEQLFRYVFLSQQSRWSLLTILLAIVSMTTAFYLGMSSTQPNDSVANAIFQKYVGRVSLTFVVYIAAVVPIYYAIKAAIKALKRCLGRRTWVRFYRV